MEPSFIIPHQQRRQRKLRGRVIGNKEHNFNQSQPDPQTNKTIKMCKTSAHLSSHIAGAKDNRIDQSNHGAVDDESYDFSIISMHLNSIGFSLTTIFLIVVGVIILQYSSKVCFRKCLFISCPCCIKGLEREREKRKSRQNSTATVPEARFFYHPPPGTQSFTIPRTQSSQNIDTQETQFSNMPPTALATMPPTMMNNIIREQPVPTRRQSNDN